VNRNNIVASTIDGYLYIFDHRKSDPAMKLSGNRSCIHDFKILK